MVLLFMGNTIVISQVEFTKHQIAINASKFLVLFNEQVNNLDITYRVAVADSSFHFRMASSIDLSTGEDAITDFSARLGVDKIFKTSKKWTYYVGADLNFGRIEAKSAKRTTTKIGILPFLGIMYNFGKHFSISTEPSLAVFRNEVIDKDSFNPEVNSTNTSIEFINIGQIKLGFHF